MPHQLAPRLPSFGYRGLHRYFLTICVDQRRPRLILPSHVRPLTSQLLTTAASYRFAVLAYCFMPDHMHALLEALTDDANFCDCVRIFKQRSAFHWKRNTGEVLWQRSYYDRVLREDEDTPAVARYILENPVRAGLVSSPLDYPFIGSGSMDVKDLIVSLDT